MMAPVIHQMAGEAAHGVTPDTAPVHGWVDEEDVERRVAVVGSFSSPYCTIPRTAPSNTMAMRVADESSKGQPDEASSSRQPFCTSGVARMRRS